MNRFNPKPRIFIKLINWKAPDTLEARADVQDLFRPQGRKPDHFRNGIGHPAAAFLTLLQRRLSALALNRNRSQMRGLLNDSLMWYSWAARLAPINREGAQYI